MNSYKLNTFGPQLQKILSLNTFGPQLQKILSEANKHLGKI